MPVILSPLSTICEYSEEKILTPRGIPTKNKDGPNHDSLVFAMLVEGYFNGDWKTPEDLESLYGCDFIVENATSLAENFIRTMNLLNDGKTTMLWDGKGQSIKPITVTPSGNPGPAGKFRSCLSVFLTILLNINLAEEEGGI